MEDQLEFARVYVTAFLEATLKGETRHLPLFRDHRTAGGWLPPTMYKTHFQHASFRPLADFGEDIDVTTGTEPGVRLLGSGLSTWREGEMVLRSRITPQRQVSQQRQGVWLGWHRADDAAPPRYRITLPDHLATAWEVDAGTTLDLEVAPTERRPSPPPSPADTADAADTAQATDPANPVNRGAAASTGADPDALETTPDDDAVAEEPMDLSVELVDAAGARASLPLANFGPLRPPLDIRVLRRSDLEASRFPTLYEVVGHGFSIPLEAFVEVNPALDPGSLREIHLVFDRTRVGEVIVSGVGLARPGPGFLEPRLESGQVRAMDGGRVTR
jgi:hypothetical protein